VQKFGRVALLLIAGLSIFAVIVFLALNLYVQSQGTQARLQQELRQRFGAALKIGRVSVTPWSGLKLSDITISQGPNGSANFLEAKNFGLRVAFLSLFSRKLVVKEVTLENPNVVWPQNGEGKWRLPDVRGEAPQNAPPSTTANENESENQKQPIIAETPVKETQPVATSTSERAPAEQRRNGVPGFVSEIHKVSVTDGNFRFLGRGNEVVANFEGVRFRASITMPVALRGNARVAKVSLRDRFFLEQLKSPLRYNEAGLDLPQISARLGGGDISGHFTMQPEGDESPFHLDMKFRGIEADQIISQAGGPNGVLQGKLEGNLQVEGKTTDPEALSGSGEVFLKDGQLQQYNLLVALGQIFQIEELTQLHLNQAQAKYHISPGLATIDNLDLRSANIHLSATGTVNFRGKLHLNSRLAVDEKVRAQLFKPIRANFQPTDEPGYSAVDFEVTGTIDRPKTNLLEKVVGRDLKDLVNSFLGGKGDKPKKKKEKAAQPESEETARQNNPDQTASPAAPTPALSP
jgi:type II secretion system protein N